MGSTVVMAIFQRLGGGGGGGGDCKSTVCHKPTVHYNLLICLNKGVTGVKLGCHD